MILYDSFLHERSQKKKREPLSSDREMFVLKDGRVMAGSTDWERLDAMTDEEVTAAALSDPDAPPLSDDQLRKFRRLPEAPGGTFLDRLRAQAEEKQQSVTIRCDADVLAFYRSQGKGYQRLMNNVLRAYMESRRPVPRAQAQ